MLDENPTLTLASGSPGETPVDDNGKPFRPGFHRVNADGSPFKGKFGQFMPRGGRKAKNATPSPAPWVETVTAPAAAQSGTSQPLPFADFSDVAEIVAAGDPSQSKAPDGKAVLVEGVTHEASAEACLRGFYAVSDGVLNGRGEWQPVDVPEHVGLKDTLVATQRALGWSPVHPAIAFVMAVTAFVLRRVRQPYTAATLAKWFPGLAPWLGVEPPPKPEAQKAAEKVAAATPEVAKPRTLTADASSFF